MTHQKRVVTILIVTIICAIIQLFLILVIGFIVVSPIQLARATKSDIDYYEKDDNYLEVNATITEVKESNKGGYLVKLNIDTDKITDKIDINKRVISSEYFEIVEENARILESAHFNLSPSNQTFLFTVGKRDLTTPGWDVLRCIVSVRASDGSSVYLEYKKGKVNILNYLVDEMKGYLD